MGKLNRFKYEDKKITCYSYDKEYVGVGIANYKESEIEDHPTRLTGETVAYLKAKRSIVKQKMAKKKEQLKYIEDFIVYLFPQKFAERADWVKERAEKQTAQIKKEIECLQKEKTELDNVIVEYLENRKDFLSRLQKNREDGKPSLLSTFTKKDSKN